MSCMICGGQTTSGTGYSLSTSVFPCQLLFQNCCMLVFRRMTVGCIRGCSFNGRAFTPKLRMNKITIRGCLCSKAISFDCMYRSRYITQESVAVYIMCSYTVLVMPSADARDEKCLVNLAGKLGLDWRMIGRVTVLEKQDLKA